MRGVAGASAAVVIGSCTTKKTEATSVASSSKVDTRYTDKKFDTIVVGAGLSGLNAAMILEENGQDVLVLEGRSRLGGRVYTLDHVPGKPEAAGEYIGANYARMRNAVTKLNLELYSPEESNGIDRSWLYNIKGTFIDKDNWASHKLNPLEGDDRTLLPHRFLSRLSDRNNPLNGQPLNAWLKPEFHQYDIPHDQYMRKLGMNEETIRLMNVVIHAGGISNTSAMNELRRYHVMGFNDKLTFKDGTGWKMIKGGNSLLPKAMSESLSNETLLNKTVVAFKEENNEVTVHCADGTNYRADNVICSIPISVLRNVVFEPRIQGITKEAIDQMDYGLSIQAHFLINRPFWKEDGLGNMMWTDGPLERFAVRSKREKGDPEAGVAFINGPESLKFRLMNDDQVFHYIEQEIYKLRPAAKGTLERLMIQSCERDIHGAGDWVYWQPGQVKKFANHMRKNHGRISFCGEHTAIMERGMEGAFESGERAALDLLMS